MQPRVAGQKNHSISLLTQLALMGESLPPSYCVLLAEDGGGGDGGVIPAGRTVIIASSYIHWQYLHSLPIDGLNLLRFEPFTSGFSIADRSTLGDVIHIGSTLFIQ